MTTQSAPNIANAPNKHVNFSGVINWFGTSGIVTNATFELHARYDDDKPTIIWHDGIWKIGVWRGGTWRGGIWEGGVCESIIWENGVWSGGDWRTGTWWDGIWEGGRWESGTWWQGDWRGGRWCNGRWNNGVWHDGEWINGFWSDGTWLGVSGGMAHGCGGKMRQTTDWTWHRIIGTNTDKKTCPSICNFHFQALY